MIDNVKISMYEGVIEQGYSGGGDCIGIPSGKQFAVLKNLDVDIERTRNEILRELDPNFTPSEEEEESYRSRTLAVTAPGRRTAVVVWHKPVLPVLLTLKNLCVATAAAAGRSETTSKTKLRRRDLCKKKSLLSCCRQKVELRKSRRVFPAPPITNELRPSPSSDLGGRPKKGISPPANFRSCSRRIIISNRAWPD